ncbi:MAG: hypothetical protein ACT4OZ_15590 [Gemmatimonadota bacterium]
MTTETLVAQLQAIYGQELVAVALYGSAARGEQLRKHTDINVLVVVERITMEHLRRESPVAQSWREGGGNPPPLTLTRSEWLSSADIYPIEYADILAHHRVLAGSLPLEGIAVDRADLRLQLEHEAMSTLLRLRHSVLLAGRDMKRLRSVLEESVSTSLVLMRALLRLLGESPSADSEVVVARVQERCGLDSASLLRIVRHARDQQPLATGEVEVTAERYLGLLQSLVSYLDRYAH